MFARRFDQDSLVRHNLERFLEPHRKTPSAADIIFGTAPLIPLAIALILGIIVQHFFRPCVFVGLIAGGAAAALFGVCRLWLFQPNLRLSCCSLAAAGMFIAAGMLRYAAFALPPPDHISRLVGQESRLATLEGVILSPIHHTDRSGWVFGRYFPTPPQSSFYLAVQRLETPDGPRSTRGQIRVQVAEIAHHLERGDRVRLYCWLSPFDGPSNPGQFDMRAYMHQKGVLLGASVPAAEGVEILDRNHDGFLSNLQQTLQDFANGALFAEAEYPDESAMLAAALLLGQRTQLGAQVYAAFQRTGLAHFISLSGMHVGILAGSLWGLSRFLGLSKPMRAVVCLVLLTGYGLVVPPRPPTVRALFLACFFLASVMINRRTRSLNTLALSAIVLLLVRPADLFSASWQLSFSTVSGILLLYDPLKKRLLSWTVFKAVEIVPRRILERGVFQMALRGLYQLMQLLAVGLAAWLGGAGFLVYHFHSVTPLASVWTVLTMPLVVGILYAGYLKIALAPLFPTLSLLSGVAMDFFCRGFSTVVSTLAQLRWSEILVGSVPIAGIVAGYATLLAIRFWPRRMTMHMGTAALLLAGAIGWNHARNGRGSLSMTCLSVGHGQAVCLSFPDKTHWLVDAGSISLKNPGHRAIVPYLRYRGIRSLEAILLTHGDLDHLNGLPEVVTTTPTAGVFANAGVFDKAKSSSSASYLQQILAQNGYPLQLIDDLDRMPSETEIRMLWPDAKTAGNMAISNNDKSQVIWLQYRGRTMLLCGDIELYAQNSILQQYPGLKADVIILPHHGSTTNLNTHFVTAFEPKIVIISCAGGRMANAYAPPNDSGIEIFYTPVDGAVTITIKADGTLSAAGFKSQKTVFFETP